MANKDITRRGFLRYALSGIAVFALGLLGCGKKEEAAPAAEPEPEAPAMTEEEKKEYIMSNCICKKCPSYVECDEDIGYCLVGKSKCIKEKKGCICPECPVTKKMDLKWGYYCTDGSAMEMMEAEKATM
jgi:hypothetical protein